MKQVEKKYGRVNELLKQIENGNHVHFQQVKTVTKDERSPNRRKQNKTKQKKKKNKNKNKKNKTKKNNGFYVKHFPKIFQNRKLNILRKFTRITKVALEYNKSQNIKVFRQ